MVKNHFTCDVCVFKKSYIKSIWQLCNSNLIHKFINVIRYIIDFFINPKLWFGRLFHLFWILIITEHRLMHFIGSAYFWHSIMFRVAFLICCHKSLLSLWNRDSIWLLLNFNLIILTDHHQVNIRNNNLFQFNLHIFLFYELYVWHKSFYCSMNVLNSIC